MDEIEITTVEIAGRTIPAQKFICPECNYLALDLKVDTTKNPWVATCPEGHTWEVQIDTIQ